MQGESVVAGAADGLEFDRDRGRARGHQEEDFEEDGVGFAGLGDREAEDVEDIPQSTLDRLALGDEVERGDDVGMV